MMRMASRQLTAGAHKNGAPAVLLSFAPHPAVVFGAKDLKCLTTPEERAEIIQANKAFYLTTGTTQEATIGRHIVEFIHPQVLEKVALKPDNAFNHFI